MARDYYDVLGVARDAGTEEIQQAFRTLARHYHPDINRDPAAEERFKELNEAYQVLADPATRSRYDRYGPDFRQVPEGFDEQAERVGAGFGGGARQRAGGAPGGGARVRAGAGPEGYAGFGGFGAGGIDIEDLLGGIFGGAAGGAAGPMPGADQEAELTISVEDAYRGGRRRVSLGGAGQRRDYQVTIPRGVTDGQRIRLAGEGGGGAGGGPAGDLYLRVRVAPHPRYRLTGRDIHLDLPITPWEAGLGATVPLVAPGGTVKVTVPAGSSTGRRLRLRGEGLPDPRGAPGDLYAHLRVAVPPEPGPRERELLREWAALSSFDPRAGGTTGAAGAGRGGGSATSAGPGGASGSAAGGASGNTSGSASGGASGRASGNTSGDASGSESGRR